MKVIDFYFDFVSPYAYLAHTQLPQLAARHGCTLAYKPIDLKETKLAAGNTGPATAQIPPKLRYAIEDFKRWSARYGVPIAFGSSGPPNPVAANRGTYYALDRGQAGEYVEAVWQATFGSGGTLGDEAVLRGVAEKLGWPVDEFLAFVESDEAGRRYAEGSEAAQKRGVFGVPTMMVGDEMWWGNDRLDFLEEHLASGAAQ